jgi:glycopeptide antibiotics resistance protein
MLEKLIFGAYHLSSAIAISTALNIFIVIFRHEYRCLHQSAFHLVIRGVYMAYIACLGSIIGIFNFAQWQFPDGISFNFIPFVNESFDLILLNFLLFIPLGFLTPIIFIRWRTGYVKFIAGSLLVCTAIEICQGIFLGRIADIDDVMANTLGCVIGFLAAGVLIKIKKRYFPTLDLNCHAPLVLCVFISFLGFGYKRVSIADIAMSRFSLPIWSGNTATVYSMSGIHYTNIIIVSMLLVPLTMSVFFYKRENNKTGLIFSLVCIFYFLLLTVYQYIIPMRSGLLQ